MNYWIYPGLTQQAKALALNDSLSNQGDINGLLDCCCFIFNVTRQGMLGPSRVQNLAFARHAFVKICRDNTMMSFGSISNYLGKRNHATAINSYNVAQDLIATDPAFKKKYDGVYFMYTKARTVQHAAKLQEFMVK